MTMRLGAPGEIIDACPPGTERLVTLLTSQVPVFLLSLG